MESGFKPSGWLGALMGTRLYFDMSEITKISSKSLALVKELGSMGKWDINYFSRTASKLVIGVESRLLSIFSGLTLLHLKWQRNEAQLMCSWRESTVLKLGAMQRCEPTLCISQMVFYSWPLPELHSGRRMAGEDQMRAVCSDFQGQVHGWDGPERFIKVSNSPAAKR